MKSDESVRALFLHLSCSFRAVCAFQYLSWNWFEKHGRARGCVSVCRNRTGVHAMRARRLKGPRGQVKTQSNRNGKRALCFVFLSCPPMDLLAGFVSLWWWMWITLWMDGWISFYGPALPVPKMNSLWFSRFSV
ncbi:uncharacterized protein BO96DRAFT_94675 [Aspergillus niger CBS 101883]|uniref:uncharacterized protein n=1 Tax=Aspergillus lacticoffeatus (strain CBS 101883) TaxID=1450533 RepID=UPI000D7FBEEA|nr:uncharacterized protein BO96DRAFT_94675 [Aspergillus niger CBS 101883]PYH61289.1 hypothetical protein BO96DRAFT_94675 [Aspergillus niger CBS 101883]